MHVSMYLLRATNVVKYGNKALMLVHFPHLCLLVSHLPPALNPYLVPILLVYSTIPIISRLCSQFDKLR